MIGSGPASLEVTFSNIKGARIYGKPFRTPNVSAEIEDPLIVAKGDGIMMMLPKNTDRGSIKVEIEGEKAFLDRDFNISLATVSGFRAGQALPCVIAPLSAEEEHQVRAAGGAAQITYTETASRETYSSVVYVIQFRVMRA